MCSYGEERVSGEGGGGRERERDKIRAEISAATDLPFVHLHTLDLLPKQLKILKKKGSSRSVTFISLSHTYIPLGIRGARCPHLECREKGQRSFAVACT